MIRAVSTPDLDVSAKRIHARNRSRVSSTSNSRRVSVRTDFEVVDDIGPEQNTNTSKRWSFSRKRRAMTPEMRRSRPAISAGSTTSFKSEQLEPKTTKTALLRQRIAIEQKRAGEGQGKSKAQQMKRPSPAPRRLSVDKPLPVAAQHASHQAESNSNIQSRAAISKSNDPNFRSSFAPFDKSALKLDFRGLHDDEEFHQANQYLPSNPIPESSSAAATVSSNRIFESKTQEHSGHDEGSHRQSPSEALGNILRSTVDLVTGYQAEVTPPTYHATHSVGADMHKSVSASKHKKIDEFEVHMVNSSSSAHKNNAIMEKTSAATPSRKLAAYSKGSRSSKESDRKEENIELQSENIDKPLTPPSAHGSTTSSKKLASYRRARLQSQSGEAIENLEKQKSPVMNQTGHVRRENENDRLSLHEKIQETKALDRNLSKHSNESVHNSPQSKLEKALQESRSEEIHAATENKQSPKSAIHEKLSPSVIIKEEHHEEIVHPEENHKEADKPMTQRNHKTFNFPTARSDIDPTHKSDVLVDNSQKENTHEQVSSTKDGSQRESSPAKKSDDHVLLGSSRGEQNITLNGTIKSGSTIKEDNALDSSKNGHHTETISERHKSEENDSTRLNYIQQENQITVGNGNLQNAPEARGGQTGHQEIYKQDHENHNSNQKATHNHQPHSSHGSDHNDKHDGTSPITNLVSNLISDSIHHEKESDHSSRSKHTSHRSTSHPPSNILTALAHSLEAQANNKHTTEHKAHINHANGSHTNGHQDNQQYQAHDEQASGYHAADSHEANQLLYQTHDNHGFHTNGDGPLQGHSNLGHFVTPTNNHNNAINNEAVNYSNPDNEHTHPISPINNDQHNSRKSTPLNHHNHSPSRSQHSNHTSHSDKANHTNRSAIIPNVIAGVSDLMKIGQSAGKSKPSSIKSDSVRSAHSKKHDEPSMVTSRSKSHVDQVDRNLSKEASVRSQTRAQEKHSAAASEKIEVQNAEYAEMQKAVNDKLSKSTPASVYSAAKNLETGRHQEKTRRSVVDDVPALTPDKLDTIRRYLEEQATVDQDRMSDVHEAIILQQTNRSEKKTAFDPVYHLTVVIERITDEKRQLTELCSQLLQQMQLTATKLIEIEARQEQSLLSLLPKDAHWRFNSGQVQAFTQASGKEINVKIGEEETKSCENCKRLEKMHAEEVEQLRLQHEEEINALKTQYEKQLSELNDKVVHLSKITTTKGSGHQVEDLVEKHLDLEGSHRQLEDIHLEPTSKEATARSKQNEGIANGASAFAKNNEQHNANISDVPEINGGQNCSTMRSSSKFSSRFENLQQENNDLKEQLEKLQHRCDALTKVIKLG